MRKEVFIGDTKFRSNDKVAEGATTTIKGEEFYLINNVDQMDPFFMTIVSSSDHWMFISSNGGLTAGRKNAENALFPYYSDDKLTQSSEFVGSKTILRLDNGNKVLLWEPFSSLTKNQYSTTRNLFKNRFGSKIIFEEINHDLNLTFRYSWQFSEKYGFVKKSKLINENEENKEIEILDGLQNVLPHGVVTHTQNLSSNLVNGYKRNLLEKEAGIGVFTLSAMIVDRPEPSEALKATTLWSSGLEINSILLCGNQLDRFRKTGKTDAEHDIKGTAGSYFVQSKLNLTARQEANWNIVAEVGQDRAAISDLSRQLLTVSTGMDEYLNADIDSTLEDLKKIVAKADGLQLSADKMSVGRHVSNVMFNAMRGGIFEENYKVEVADFLDYLKTINTKVFNIYSSAYAEESVISYQELVSKAKEIGDTDLIRISYEYLPLTFSRRHGDPSRPWNKFNIDLKNSDGSKKRSYEGNWRDIFQNWEALAYSFPEYSLGMVFKFLNASTIDGYNPYRITRKGIDWEIIEPDDPWSYIGYWGDHQIIYLQKLLECAHKHDQNVVDEWLNNSSFVFANVPYDIKSYDDIVSNHKDTIDYNLDKEHLIEQRVAEVGADGKFVMIEGQLLKSTLLEKMLVTLLAKLSNFVPEGGIWLNTQRPEWNDANNALVGNGVSMVTLYYLRRFCKFLDARMHDSSVEKFNVNQEIASLFSSIDRTLNSHEPHLDGRFSDSVRKSFVDQMGRAGETYRNKAYAGFTGDRTDLSKSDLKDFLERTILFIDHSIRANKREDGLYHSYNLLEFKGEELKVDHLYEMLEGQVAVLSSGFLSGQESLDVLDALKTSKMYREDQYSYFLYPNRDIPHFLSKNQLPSDFVKNSQLVQDLKKVGDTSLVTFDTQGNGYFNGDIHNAADVKERLSQLPNQSTLVDAEGANILNVFEEMFDHKSFTGRSGTFFAFEGLGSIYWHMVSKLLYAAQESIYWNLDELNDDEKGKLVQHYYEIRAGIGINKNPSLYGAFPTDPYSHTPLHKGAQQPGMTGQVKEDVLNRWAELGVIVQNGNLSFEPKFLSKNEFLKESDSFIYYDLKGEKQELDVSTGQLAFTYCQVPIIYELSSKSRIEIILTENEQTVLEENFLPSNLSKSLFLREGKIKLIKVGILK